MRRRPPEGARQEDRGQEVTQEAMEATRPRPGGRPQPGGPQEGAPTGGRGQHEPAARQEEREQGEAQEVTEDSAPYKAAGRRREGPRRGHRMAAQASGNRSSDEGSEARTWR
jgi:hypothetical protein